MGIVLLLVTASLGTKAAADPAAVQPEVTFLEREPLIDGRLDPELRSLPRRSFGVTLEERPHQSELHGHFRMAYGTEFLYVYVEYAAPAIVCRDRGYQNGDGMTLVLGRAGPGGTSYVLAYHPDAGGRVPFRQMMWQHDDAWPFARLGERNRFAALAEGGRVGFEVLLRWDEVPPIHPWLGGEITYNVVLAKAVGATGTVGLAVVDPEAPDSKNPTLRFETPRVSDGAQSYALLTPNHLSVGAALSVRVATIAAAPGEERMTFRIESGEGTRMGAQTFSFDVSAGVRVHEQVLHVADLVPGGYRVRWETPDHPGEGVAGLTVLPPFDLPARRAELALVRARVNDGTYQTMRFELEQIGRDLGSLKPWDTCAPLRTDVEHYLELVSVASSGRDPLAARSGLLRRAFVSAVDQQVQPYTIYVPPGLDASRKHPAIVFLHGSDSDDRSLENAMKAAPILFPAGVFVIAPNGRGPRTDFGVDFAQDDIREAVADATRQYPIDTTRLVLGGFSMGGYGVLRTLWENPKAYAGGVVFSGSPDARSGGGRDQPDFREPANIERLRREKLLFVHGRKDRNCPVELVVDLVGRLEKAGVPARLLLDAQIGHETPRDPKVIGAYLDWLRTVIAGTPAH